MIKTEGLTRNYGDLIAVADVSFEIGRGEIVGLLGHNGAGKTTIMKMITGYLEPSAGRITVDGMDLAEFRTEIQAKIGYLPENCPLYPEMTVIDYLEYAAGLRGLDGDACRRAVREAIRQTELESKAADPINTLSRGYRQRAGVAQAILTRPELLILDEPTNGLDPSQIYHMRELITELGKNATVILSTHILQEVEAICDRVVIIRNGRLALDSKLHDLKRSRRLLISLDTPLGKTQELLSRVDGVGPMDCVDQGPGTWSYAMELPEADRLPSVAPAIARTVIENGHALYALHPETRDLETVFRQINTVKSPASGGSAHAA
ncbi:MAG: ABC transporter ATP-binding protein [Pseudomonadota bacterium]